MASLSVTARIDDRAAHGWIPAAVGCYWRRGEFYVSTITCGSRSGYSLHKSGQLVAEFITWTQVEQLAERRK